MIKEDATSPTVAEESLLL